MAKQGDISPFEFADPYTKGSRKSNSGGFWNTYGGDNSDQYPDWFGNSDDSGNLNNYALGSLQNGGVATGQPTTQSGLPVDQTFGHTPWDSRSNDLYNMLMQRAQQSLNVNSHDPIIRNQVDSFGANEERSRRNYLNEVAEQAGPIANTSAERRHSAEKVSQDTANFQGQLMSRELEARRNEIAQALFMMGSLLTDEQRMSLQHELAMLENALGRDSLSERSREFDINNQNTLAGL